MTDPSPSLFDQAPSDGAWRVGHLTRTAKRLLEQQIGPLWVLGEVSSLKRHRNGHWYFTLQDEDAQIRCVMWRDDAPAARSAPADGTRVYASGMPTVWAERGELRFTVKKLMPTEGLGLQQALLEQTKAALQADGMLDPSRKRPLPAFATGVAVVTSLDGAALHDMISLARRRWPIARVTVVGARVQGADAEHEVARALALVNQLDGVDVCIVGRGGGAREDLAVFNTERVCRALAAVPVPTISAVGHETDITLTDLVADVRAATPTAAAELALPDQVAVLRELDGLATRLAAGLTARTQLAGSRFDGLGGRLQRAMSRAIDGRRHRLERLATALDALSPLRVLDRGYSVAMAADGSVLKRREEFGAGEPFTLRVSDGTVAARVEE